MSHELRSLCHDCIAGLLEYVPEAAGVSRVLRKSQKEEEQQPDGREQHHERNDDASHQLNRPRLTRSSSDSACIASTFSCSWYLRQMEYSSIRAPLCRIFSTSLMLWRYTSPKIWSEMSREQKMGTHYGADQDEQATEEAVDVKSGL